jgi:thioredoxin
MTTQLLNESFKEKVFEYDIEKEWKFKGDKPAIVDFYADWCGPCKMIAPILEELSEEYAGKIDIYKVNVDEAHEVSGAFGVQSIPAVLFVPLEGQPQMSVGGLPKSTFEEAIKNVLKVE